ncbi:hypothetical protein CYMTET_17562 [Cymbomonas tetramitiformis]|uniref:UDP-glucose 4-epimerase n=1 Tax=Cymbomonas tetramitiformis TaxID=36881 RepID=A0AAE0GA52_9CHLO|nr:hypothetical protein CYMTET_17562 [Cymbomonas tetramitiformis]
MISLQQQVLRKRGIVGCLAFFFTILVYLLSGGEKDDIRLSQAPGGGRMMHVLVTGGAGFIGSHASMRLLGDGHAVTAVDNLSRGNIGAIRILEKMAARNRFRFVEADLGDIQAIHSLFEDSSFDLVLHFAAVAYVGESMAEPLRYYSNITSNTVNLLKVMERHSVNNLIYSSTCAVYGNPEKLPITEKTPTVPINPYGKSKLAAETVVRDFMHSNPEFKAAVLRYFNVYGSDPKGRLGEYPRPDLRKHGRISGACFDAALGHIDELTIMGTNFPTPDGTCIRDYVHVTDLVDAHVTVMNHLQNPPVLYNVGTGKGNSVREFVDTCLKVTGSKIKVREQAEARPGDYAEVFADTSKIREELNWTARYNME